MPRLEQNINKKHLNYSWKMALDVKKRTKCLVIIEI